MVSAALQISAPLGMRKHVFSSMPAGCVKPASWLSTRPRVAVKADNMEGPGDLSRRVLSGIAAAQLILLPLSGASFAALDTETTKKGVGATIEASDISGENQKSVLEKLQKKILPEAKQLLGKVGKGEGSNYPSSVAKELETVEEEIEGLIRQANEGGDMSNIKSSASGIEQQINALKAIVGFD